MAPNSNQKKSKRKPLTKSKRRAARRLIAKLIKKKRTLNNNRDIDVASCATRTVELPSTRNIGEERNKLLFMLSLGLIPNYKKTVEPSAHVPMEKLDHQTFLKAQAKTEERIKKILEKKLLDEIIQPKSQISVREPRPLKLIPLKLIPEFEKERVSPDIVELVDLISDDDDNFDSSSSCNCISCFSPEPEEEIVDLVSSDDEDFDDQRQTNLPTQTQPKSFSAVDIAFPTPPSSGTGSPITVDDLRNCPETIDFVNFHKARTTRNVSKRKRNASRRTVRRSQINKVTKVTDESMLNSDNMSVGLNVNCRLIAGKNGQVKKKSRNSKEYYEIENILSNPIIILD